MAGQRTSKKLASMTSQTMQQRRMALIASLIALGMTESSAVQCAYQQHLAFGEPENQAYH